MTSRYEVAVHISNYAEAAAWKAHLAEVPMQVVYYLATPIAYQLTPQEIKTLLGDNTVYSDGDSVEVAYRADVKRYVDKKIAEVQALILEKSGN